MEKLEDIQSDLQALKKLYGLLQFQGKHPPINGASPPNLDEKAKLVLKKLLDGATKQIISEEQQSVKTTSEDHQPKLQSLVPPDTLYKTSPPIDAISKVSDKDASFNPITSQTSKRCRICGKNRDRDHRRYRNSSVHHHEVNSSTRPKESAKGIDNTKKPKLSKIHDVKCNKEMWFKSEPAGCKSFEQNEIKKPEKMVADFVQRFGARTKGLDSMKDKDLFPTKYKSDMVKEEDVEKNGTGQVNRPVGVAEAIRRIEARIRANQLMLSNRVVDSMKEQKCIESKHQHSKISQLLEMKDGSSQKSIPSHLASEKDQNNKHASNALLPKTVTSGTRNSLLSQLTSEIRRTKDAATSTTRDQKSSQKPYRFTAGSENDLRIPKDVRAKKSMLPGPSQKCGQTGRKLIPERNELPNRKTSLTNKSVLERVTSPSQKTKESTLPTQMLTHTKPRASERKIGLAPRVVGPIPVKAHLVGPPLKKDLTRVTTTTNQRRTPLDVNHKQLSRTREYDKPRQHIILPTLLNGTYKNVHLDPPKKQMPYQQNRSRKPMSVSSSSESESTSGSYSTASDSTTQEGSSSNSCSESDSDPQPCRMNTSQQTGPTSRYRSSNVSQTRERSRSVEHEPMVGTSRHVGSTKSRKGSEKEIGRLRKFKNKLGIIFHHHHHHHHHHDAANVLGTTASDHHRSLWKYLGEILHHPTTSKYNGRKSMVKNPPHQNQHGYLHTLVDGFIRHMRHSKKSKKSEADMKRLGKNGSREKKKKKAVVKKWHWWQKLRGNSSNNGKTRVKVLGSRKRSRRKRPYSPPNEENESTDLPCPQCGTEVGGFQCNRATAHLQCHACGGMMPSRTNITIPQHCLGCDRPFCGAYWQAQGVVTSNSHTVCSPENFKPISEPTISRISSLTHQSNRHEQDITGRCIRQMGKTLQDVISDWIIKLNNREIDRTIMPLNHAEMITAGTHICNDCYDKLVSFLLYWFRISSPKYLLPPDVLKRENCWYGFSCRTQHHSKEHARKRNHVCRPTRGNNV